MSLAHDTAAVFDAALALPLEKREELAKELIISIDRDVPKHPDYDRLWAEELQRRGSEIERGEMELIEHDEAMRRIRNAIQR